MTIQLNPEEERLIGKADDVVSVGVATIRRQLQSRVGSGSELNTEQWLREFKAWVHGHATTTPLLSDEAISGDSIYGALGL
jgi:hypothetical protein